MTEIEFARLYDLFRNDVFRLAYYKTGNYADAEDVFQIVFLKLYMRSSGFIANNEAKAWLLTVTTNCANDLLDSYWHRCSEPLPDSIYDIPAPEKELPDSDIYEMIDSLSEFTRQTVYAYYIYGYSVREIAEITDCSHDALKARLMRGRRQMKRFMENRYPLTE